MTGSQKLFVFAGVLLGGLGLALPFRQLSPNVTSMPAGDVPQVDGRMTGRLSLSIEAGNEANLPSPRGQTPYFGSGGAGFQGNPMRETPVIEQSPAFHEPRPNDPLPRMGNRYEPLLERRPFRESQRTARESADPIKPEALEEESVKPSGLAPTFDISPGSFIEESQTTPTISESESNPVSTGDAEQYGERVDGDQPLATLDRDRIHSTIESSDPSSGSWQRPSLAIDSQRHRGSALEQESSLSPEPIRPTDSPLLQNDVDREAWAGSPRLRGWRETQIARAGEGFETRTTKRNAPFARYRSYRLRDGDTLPGLAQRFLGSENRYSEILESNRDILRDPQVLPLGVEIRIPYP